METQFAYVDPCNKTQQDLLKEQYIAQLKSQGAYVDYFRAIDPEQGSFPVEASVVIPVRNRHRTVRQAVESALGQKADFSFNVIVVDNASTDGTSDILASIADPRLVVISEDGHLGIGGCWNRAVNSVHAGRFVVQLDSDDVYQSTDTLQRIIDTFRRDKCGMVVGSYTLTDMDGNILPPGIIDHREWTPGDGANNLLRVNGIGAPRAFHTPVIRQVGFPDVSYGEDYAAALRVSGEWRVSRIFDSLYLCRRWEGNSDHKLSAEKIAEHDAYKNGLRQNELDRRKEYNRQTPKEFLDEWKELERWRDRNVGKPETQVTRVVESKISGCEYTLLHLPNRAISATAKTDSSSIAARPCFLCKDNRPQGQPHIDLGKYELLANPMPIFPRHTVIASVWHEPQDIHGKVEDMVRIAARLEKAWPKMVTYFNGARAGASAPDHLHFQAAEFELKFTPTTGGEVRIGYINGLPAIATESIEAAERLLNADNEGLVNVFVKRGTIYVMFRTKHRPACYPTPLVSPGSTEVAGYIVLPRREDFDEMDADTLDGILREVTQPIGFYEELVKPLPSCPLCQ